jgi:hypothetical protein
MGNGRPLYRLYKGELRPTAPADGRSHHKGGNIVAYVGCWACGHKHRNIQQADIVKILEEFQAGNGQVMTPDGVETLCILDILGVDDVMRETMENDASKSNPHSRRYLPEFAIDAALAATV